MNLLATQLNMKSFNKSSTAEEVTEGLDLSGQTILVTGCNSGLGLEKMRVLAMRGARVLGTARTAEKAANACNSIEGNTVPLVCDLSEPNSVKELIESVNESLHAIIANAGVMALQERTIKHGIESHFLVNHVGHFMLVNGLLDRLTTNGRIVVLASAAHAFARGNNVNFDDTTWNRPYKPWSAYGYSKLANILFTKELAKRLPEGQTSNSLHPGIIYTPLWRHIPEPEADKMKAAYGFKTIEQGAATGVFLATHPSVENVSGEYFSNCKIGSPSALAQDDNLAKHLWEVTEKLVARF